jgi:hypothetical protein
VRDSNGHERRRTAALRLIVIRGGMPHLAHDYRARLIAPSSPLVCTYATHLFRLQIVGFIALVIDWEGKRSTMMLEGVSLKRRSTVWT